MLQPVITKDAADAKENPASEGEFLRKMMKQDGISEAAKVVGGRAKLAAALTNAPFDEVFNIHKPRPYRLGRAGDAADRIERLNTIKNYAAIARTTDGKSRHMELGAVASYARILSDSGKDLSGFAHVLDAAKVRHIFDTHGDPAKEARQGQRAVVESDFAQLSEVVDAYDSVALSARRSNGNLEVLEFVKRIGREDFHYRAEIRTGKRHLAPTTLFIKVI